MRRETYIFMFELFPLEPAGVSVHLELTPCFHEKVRTYFLKIVLIVRAPH